MVKYELKYFNLRARGEIVRIILAAAKQEFKDTRYEFDEWPSQKPSIPGKALPVFIIDGQKTYTQSLAIARYLSKLYDFYGKNDEESFAIDEIVDAFLDPFNALVRIRFSPANMKEEFTTKYNEICLRILEFLENKVEAGKHHFVGNRLTLADMCCFVYLESAVNQNGDLLKNFPKLKAVRENVSKVSSIADYLKRRPVTDF